VGDLTAQGGVAMTFHDPATAISRRGMLKLVVSSVGVGLLAACGPAAAPAGPTAVTASPTSVASAPNPTPLATVSTARATSQPTSSPVSGGTLRSTLHDDPPSLDGHLVANGIYENVWLVYDRLSQYDDKLQPQPMLAESWDLSSDDTQVKFNLRKGVQWHTGRDFTSDDVKYNLTRIRDPKVGLGRFTSQAKWFASIETPDKSTVVLKMDQSRPLLFDFLEYFNMVDQATVEGPQAQTTAVGTGPFAFGEWVQGDHITFNRNKSYWLSNRPYLDAVRVSIYHDAPAVMTQLEANALDIVLAPPLIDFARLKADPSYQAIIHPNSGFFYLLGANASLPPLDNKLVRQALNYAIDRNRFSTTALNGIGTPQDLPWGPGSAAFDASKQTLYTFDLDKAKSLLGQSGMPGVEFDILFEASTEATTFAQMYQADLATIGVKANVKPLEHSVFLDQVTNLKYTGVYWSAASMGHLTPGTLFSTSGGLRPENNNSGFKDANYAKLVADATSETDASQIAQTNAQLNDVFLDESFSIVVSTAPPTALAHSNVHSVTPNYHGSFSFTDTWLG
jgi:peptide/nickel transport system substrate-binding protein